MKNLFVGNMSFQTTESELSELFKAFGQVTRVHIAMDRETGRSKGFGFVEMSTDEEAKAAVDQLNGKDLNGRAVAVSEARPQAPRENRNFGGNSGGGYNDRRY